MPDFLVCKMGLRVRGLSEEGVREREKLAPGKLKEMKKIGFFNLLLFPGIFLVLL